MSMHNNYNPNIYKVYLPIILFNICVSLSLIDIVLYHFWHYTNIYLIMMNSVTLVGLIIILIYQFSHSKFLFYLRSLFLTRNIFHMMIIPKEISETTGKVKINAIVNLYNTSQRQTYGEFVNNKLYICVRIPNNIEASKKLDDKLVKLRESIGNSYPEYSFTGFDRKGSYICVGTK